MSKWIKCGERMPPPSAPMNTHTVIIWMDEEGIEKRARFGRWIPTLGWREEGSPSPANVTHWMPLPDPPEVP